MTRHDKQIFSHNKMKNNIAKLLIIAFLATPAISFASEYGFYIQDGGLNQPTLDIQLTPNDSNFSSVSNLEISLQDFGAVDFYVFLACNGDYQRLFYYVTATSTNGTYVFSPDTVFQCASGGISLTGESNGTNDSNLAVNWNYEIANFHGFTQGELVISFFLVIIMMSGVFSFIINHFIDKKK